MEDEISFLGYHLVRCYVSFREDMSPLNSCLDILQIPGEDRCFETPKSLLRRSVAGSNASWKDVWISRGCDHSHRIRVWFMCTYICHKIQLNVGRYTIHGCYGINWYPRGRQSTNKNPVRRKPRQTVRFFCPVPPKVFVGGWAWELRTMENNESTSPDAQSVWIICLHELWKMAAFKGKCR